MIPEGEGCGGWGKKMKKRPEECQVALAEMMDVQARGYRHQSIGPKTFFCATRSSLHRAREEVQIIITKRIRVV